MKKPVLVIMAAGMGSRYGGLKQIDPIDEQGHIIMDFSIFDAKRAGFEEVIFIIKKENEELFRSCIGDRISKIMKVSYVFQDINNLPEGYVVPEGRIKPWGTGHAVLSCLGTLDAPFAVINADDYYGRNAFQMIYDFLTSYEDDEKYHYTMVGYILENKNELDKCINIFSWIQRSQMFLDGNKRVANLVANKEMIRNGQGIISVPVEKIGEYFNKLINYYETNDNDELKKWLYETSVDGI